MLNRIVCLLLVVGCQVTALAQNPVSLEGRASSNVDTPVTIDVAARRLMKERNYDVLERVLDERSHRSDTLRGWLYWYHPARPPESTVVSFDTDVYVFAARNGLLHVLRWSSYGWVDVIAPPSCRRDADQAVAQYLRALDEDLQPDRELEFVSEVWRVRFIPRLERYPGGDVSTISVFLNADTNWLAAVIPMELRERQNEGKVERGSTGEW